jgi:signal transduction histidine kinase/CheY-like chemotaxis protein
MTPLPLTDALFRPPALTLVAPVRLTDRERLELLLEAGRILEDAGDLVGALRELARLVVGRLGDACLIDLVSDGTAVPLAVAHADLVLVDDVEDLRRRHPPRLEDRAGVAEVLRTGRAELHAELPREAASLRAFREIGAAVAMVAPIRAPICGVGPSRRAQVLGAITVLASAERRFEGLDLRLLEDLGTRAGQAAASVSVRNERPPRSDRDRERLLSLEKQARAAAEVAVHRISTLQGVTAALSEAVSLAQVADIIVRESLFALGARAGTVHLLDAEQASLDLVAQRGLLPAGAAAMARLPLDIASPVMVSAVNAGRPVWIVGADRVRAACPDLARRLSDDHEPGALAAIPLAVGGHVAGVLGMVFDAPQDLPEEDRVFALALVRHCAQAIDRARLYEAERLANQRLTAASHAKDEFLGVVSHELRTPLNAVLGWSQLLRGPAASDPAVLAKGLKVIDRNARAQAKLIEDILDVSRIITGKLRLELRPIELDGVIRAALEVVRPAAEAKGVELTTTIAAGAAVSGDADRLQQVAWNLVSNAVKFTPEGGRVEISVVREATCVLIVVRDSGRGIEPDLLPHVFERFWQADSSPTRRHGGLGLGLAIVRHLVELHGGSVRAESGGDGRGATFIVQLPVREDGPGDGDVLPLRDSDPSNPAALRAQLDGVRVLVVDDEADARELVATMLSAAGATVTTASSTEDALAVLDLEVPDVLVSDVGMPGEDGLSLLRRVRASRRLCRLPAVALTAYASSEDARRAVLAGFHTHIPKPAEPAMLAAVVASLAGRVT